MLKEDPRLSDVLGMEYDRGAMLCYVRKQMRVCIYNKAVHNGELFLNRWFLVVRIGKGILSSHVYKKTLRLRSTDNVKQFTIIDEQFFDMKTHFELIIRRKTGSAGNIFLLSRITRR